MITHFLTHELVLRFRFGPSTNFYKNYIHELHLIYFKILNVSKIVKYTNQTPRGAYVAINKIKYKNVSLEHAFLKTYTIKNKHINDKSKQMTNML